MFCIIRCIFVKKQLQTQNQILISGFICSYHLLTGREKNQITAAYEANPQSVEEIPGPRVGFVKAGILLESALVSGLQLRPGRNQRPRFPKK